MDRSIPETKAAAAPLGPPNPTRPCKYGFPGGDLVANTPVVAKAPYLEAAHSAPAHGGKNVVNCSPFPHRWGKGLQLTTFFPPCAGAECAASKYGALATTGVLATRSPPGNPYLHGRVGLGGPSGAAAALVSGMDLSMGEGSALTDARGGSDAGDRAHLGV